MQTHVLSACTGCFTCNRQVIITNKVSAILEQARGVVTSLEIGKLNTLVCISQKLQLTRECTVPHGCKQKCASLCLNFMHRLCLCYNNGLLALSLLFRSRGLVSDDWCPPRSLNSLYSALANALSAAASASTLFTCFLRFALACTQSLTLSKGNELLGVCTLALSMRHAIYTAVACGSFCAATKSFLDEPGWVQIAKRRGSHCKNMSIAL